MCMRPETSFDTQGLLIRSIISLLSVCGDSWPHVREMERVTLLDPILEDEPPFYLDGDGERHYNVVLGDRSTSRQRRARVVAAPAARQRGLSCE